VRCPICHELNLALPQQSSVVDRRSSGAPRAGSSCAPWPVAARAPRGDTHHDHMVADIVARLMELPRRAVVLARRDPPEPAAARAGQLDTARRPPADPHARQEPASHRAGRDRGHHRAVGAPARPTPRDRLHCLAGNAHPNLPAGPGDVVICDNDSIHHARAVTAYPDNTRAWKCSTAPGMARAATRLSAYGPGGRATWPTPPSPGPATPGRSAPSSATAHRARCSTPPHRGPAPGCLRVTSRASGMPLRLHRFSEWLINGCSGQRDK
jgi:hypothetical protein